MKLQIRNQKDFYTGLLFIAFGMIFLFISPSYTIGSPSRIGPGFFPVILSALLVIVGLLTSVRGLRFSDISLDEFAFGPLVLVTLSIILFAMMINWVGMIVTVVLVTILASYASNSFKLQSRLILAIILATFSVLLFVLGLGMPVPIFGGRLFS